MTDTEPTDDVTPDVPEADTSQGDISDATPEGSDSESHPDEPDTFPRQVVEDLRQENGRYRQRAQKADDLAHRLHTELVRATGRLADPTDLAFDEAHLEEGDSLSLAIDELLERKPHLATRRPSGDIGQGHRGVSSEPVSLLQMLKDRT